MTQHATLEPASRLPAGTRRRDIVGIKQIADRLGVSAATVHKWQQRAHTDPPESRRIPIPPPDGYVSKTPWWIWHRIETWAAATGRLQPANNDAPQQGAQQ